MTQEKAGKAVVKPFELKKEFTRFSNDLIDHVMPRVSPAAWKIMTVIWRQTEGWVEDKKTGKRKEWDEISYSQFMEKTGIGSTSTISKGLKDLIKGEYINRAPATKKGGALKRQSYKYRVRDQIQVKTAEPGRG